MANWPAIGSVILPNVGGWANGLYFAGQIKRDDNEKTWYDELKKPSWNPPKWVFGPAWTALYSGMGYASYLVLEECDGFTDMCYNQKTWYDELKKPSWNPSKWVFGPAWTALYSGMGCASYLVLEECDGFTERAVLPMTLYGTQLLLNWAWTPIFFGLKDFKLALIEIAVLSGAATVTTISFASVNKTAGVLMLPYLAWLGYASSLTYYIWKNNPTSPKVTEIKDEKAK